MEPRKIIAIGLIAAGLFLPRFIGGSNTPSTPDAPAPTAELQTAVAPLAQALQGHAKESAALEQYFGAFADLVAANPSLITTTGGVRAQHSRATELYFGTLTGSVPGLAKAIDDSLAGALGGLEDKPITNAQLVSALRALQWACGRAA